MDNLSNVSEHAREVAALLFDEVDAHITGALLSDAETLTTCAEHLFGALMAAPVGSDDEYWYCWLEESAREIAKGLCERKRRHRKPEACVSH